MGQQLSLHNKNKSTFVYMSIVIVFVLVRCYLLRIHILLVLLQQATSDLQRALIG